MVERYVEVTNEYVKQLEQEIDNLKKINEEHKKINGKLREEYNKIQNLYESVFAESKKQQEVIDKAIEYMKDFIFEPLLTNEDRKLIMYNDNLRNFEKILKEVE